MHIVRQFYAQIRAKTPQRIGHALARRIWPFSSFLRAFYWIYWSTYCRDYVNRGAIKAYKGQENVLNDKQQSCVQDLREQGICITTLDQVTGDTKLLDKLQLEASRLLLLPAVQQEIQNRRAKYTTKWYVIRPLGYGRAGTLSPTFLDFFLNPQILAMVNAYHGMYSRLWLCNLVVQHPRSATCALGQFGALAPRSRGSQRGEGVPPSRRYR